MGKEDQGKRKSLSPLFLSIVSGILLMAFCIAAAASADDGISITCYRDVKSSFSFGRVVVFDVAGAAAACNSMYYDCRGRCIGCYHDFDYVDNVCVDALGNTFLK